MDIENAIRSRRTHKSFGPDPVPRETLDELFGLARWAPNHHLTQPWRFRVLGPHTFARLKEAAGPSEAMKLDRAPTLVVASAKLSGDLVQDEEDLHATACAVYVVLLGAQARGLASYWRTPAVLRTKSGRIAVGLSDGERFVGLITSAPSVRNRRSRSVAARATTSNISTRGDDSAAPSQGVRLSRAPVGAPLLRR